MSIKAIPCHTTQGRVRLKLLEPLPNTELEAVSKRLLALPSTTAVQFSKVTGSLVLSHSLSSTAEYLERISEEGDVDIVTSRPLSGAGYSVSLERLDQRIKELTGGECGIREATAIAFTTMGLVQFGKGVGLPAGLTLLINAARIMRTQPVERAQLVQ